MSSKFSSAFEPRFPSLRIGILQLMIIALMGLGLIQVFSTSFIYAGEHYNDGLFFFKRQICFALVALGTMIWVSRVPHVWIEKSMNVVWFVSLALLAFTLIPGMGVRVGGASRWLGFGLFRLEPSEFIKVIFPIYFGSVLALDQKKKEFWAHIASLVLCLAMLLRQPDFGCFSILICVAAAMVLVSGLIPWKILLGSAFAFLPVFLYLLLGQPYRRARIDAFLNPWNEPETKGFQIIQSMLSFSSGHFFGAGLGQGQGKLFFLPEAHTDFTLAVFAEETGFVGFLVLMLILAFLIVRGFQISVRVEDPKWKVASFGLILTFALMVLINCGVVLGLLPTKGLAFPFLSYGGSSLFSLAILFGVLLNLGKNQVRASLR